MTEPVGQTDDKKPRENNALRWAFAIVAGLALAVVLVVGLNMSESTYMVDGDGNVVMDGETLESETPGSQAVATDAKPLDPATTDPDVFKNQPYELILTATVPYLASQRNQSLAEIEDYGRKHPILPGLKTPEQIDSPAETPEGIEAARSLQVRLRNYAADVHTVSRVAQTSPAYAQNLALAVTTGPASSAALRDQLDPSSEKFASEINPMLGAVLSSRELTTGVIGNYTMTPDAPTTIGLVDDYDHGIVSETGITYPLINIAIASFEYQGDKRHDVVVQILQEQSPGFVLRPDRL
ncbi:hypothetical protein [Mycolicibacterium sp. A43C]